MNLDMKAPVEQSVAQQGVAPSKSKRLNYSNPAQRSQHIHAFLEWLPPVLNDAPGICWDHLPSQVMGYLVRTVADSPDAPPIALALGSAMDAIKKKSLLTYSYKIYSLLRQLRTQYELQGLSQLKSRSFWERFISERTLSRDEVNGLVVYEALSAIHLRAFLEKLDVRQQLTWEKQTLPPLPIGFLEKYGLVKTAHAASEKRRKEQSDVLVPLFHLLVEIAQLRKQAAERLTKAFRRHRDRAIAGEITLPFHFQHTDRIFSVSENAATIAEISFVEQEVTLSFTLWDRTSWAKAFEEYYCDETKRRARRQIGGYKPSKNFFFCNLREDQMICSGTVISLRIGDLAR